MSRDPATPAVDVAAAARRLMAGKAKPAGALGRLEHLAVRLARQTRCERPVLDTCELLLFAADHGIAAEGVSAYPADVTRLMLQTFLAGRAAANVIAAGVGATVTVIDAGVAGAPVSHPCLVDRRIAAGTANSARTPAMSADQLERALAAGRELARARDATALCLGEMGIGNTSAATLVAHKLTGLPLDALAGPGTGMRGDGFAHKLDVLRRAARRTGAAPLDPAQAMAQYGGFEIAMMAGALDAAVRARRIVIVDGFIATVAALFAVTVDAALADGLVYAHRSAEPGHAHLLETLGATPLLDLGLALGEGTGALLAWPLVRSAADLLRDMASLADIGATAPASAAAASGASGGTAGPAQRGP